MMVYRQNVGNLAGDKLMNWPIFLEPKFLSNLMNVTPTTKIMAMYVFTKLLFQ